MTTFRPRTVTMLAGSRPGRRPEFADEVRVLVQHLVDAGFRIKYGGGSTGLMGVVADAVLDAHGDIEGVMPAFLADGEALHPRLTSTTVVTDMATRKKQLFADIDAVLVLPGGVGTLEEFFDAYSELLLGQSLTPIVVYDIGGYWHRLRLLLASLVAGEFLAGEEIPCVGFADTPQEALTHIDTWCPPPSRIEPTSMTTALSAVG